MNWPRSLFWFFHKKVWKAQTNFLANSLVNWGKKRLFPSTSGLFLYFLWASHVPEIRLQSMKLSVLSKDPLNSSNHFQYTCRKATDFYIPPAVNIYSGLFMESFKYACLVDQMLKNLPAMQETRVRSLDWEDLLEKEMAIHSSILAWRIPWTEKLGELYIVHGVAKSRTQLSD